MGSYRRSQLEPSVLSTRYSSTRNSCRWARCDLQTVPVVLAITRACLRSGWPARASANGRKGETSLLVPPSDRSTSASSDSRRSRTKTGYIFERARRGADSRTTGFGRQTQDSCHSRTLDLCCTRQRATVRFVECRVTALASHTMTAHFCRWRCRSETARYIPNRRDTSAP
jgi:hypothetical protein